MSIIGIVAIAKNYAIGRGGKLPWHYPADLKFFKETTTGNAVAMGANTWKSIGRPLPNRTNIVLTHSGNVVTPPEVLRFRGKDELLEFADSYGRNIFIIGGAQVYAAMADVINKWLVTEIPVTVEDADTFMPKDFLNGFEEVQTKDLGDGLRVRILRRK